MLRNLYSRSSLELAMIQAPFLTPSEFRADVTLNPSNRALILRTRGLARARQLKEDRD